jgi:hypothetical protein
VTSESRFLYYEQPLPPRTYTSLLHTALPCLAVLNAVRRGCFSLISVPDINSPRLEALTVVLFNVASYRLVEAMDFLHIKT